MTSPTMRRAQAQALDERILQCIEQWRNGAAIPPATIDTLLLETAGHQLTYNVPYRRYAATLKFRPEHLHDWRDIPVVPATAFKDTELASFDHTQAQRCFQTSGTSQQGRGRHYMETSQLYDAAAKAIFQRLVLEQFQWQHQKLRILTLTPDAHERPDSSLAHMVATLIHEWGDEQSRGFLRNETLDVQGFLEALAATKPRNMPLCIIGTAIAYAHLLRALPQTPLALSQQAIVIETGGFKGRDFKLDPAMLYSQLGTLFGLAPERIFAEFGMTELSSQYYDSPASRQHTLRVKIGPPWLRARIVDASGVDVAPGAVGILRHYDLANRSSVVGIETEDLATAVGRQTFLLIGREMQAELRGCSLDAEGLRTLVDPLDHR